VFRRDPVPLFRRLPFFSLVRFRTSRVAAELVSGEPEFGFKADVSGGGLVVVRARASHLWIAIVAETFSDEKQEKVEGGRKNYEGGINEK
jgi:hypothetical protein